jgi:hypothetical protein
MRFSLKDVSEDKGGMVRKIYENMIVHQTKNQTETVRMYLDLFDGLVKSREYFDNVFADFVVFECIRLSTNDGEVKDNVDAVFIKLALSTSGTNQYVRIGSEAFQTSIVMATLGLANLRIDDMHRHFWPSATDKRVTSHEFEHTNPGFVRAFERGLELMLACELTSDDPKTLFPNDPRRQALTTVLMLSTVYLPVVRLWKAIAKNGVTDGVIFPNPQQLIRTRTKNDVVSAYLSGANANANGEIIRQSLRSPYVVPLFLHPHQQARAKIGRSQQMQPRRTLDVDSIAQKLLSQSMDQGF